MKLTLPEMIQLLRKRMGLNQAQFGAQVFRLSEETGRTKIKNIELGKQKPTPDDLVKMARVLDVPESMLRQVSGNSTEISVPSFSGVLVDAVVLDRFEGVKDYLEMLNRAVSIRDEELVAHIADKLSDLFSADTQLKAVNN